MHGDGNYGWMPTLPHQVMTPVNSHDPEPERLQHPDQLLPDN